MEYEYDSPVVHWRLKCPMGQKGCPGKTSIWYTTPSEALSARRFYAGQDEVGDCRLFNGPARMVII